VGGGGPGRATVTGATATVRATDAGGTARALRFAVRAALAAAVLLFVPGLLDPFDVSKAAVLRLLGLPLLAFVLVERVRRGARPAGSPGLARLLDLAVIAWVAVSALATLFGISPRLSWMGEMGQREGMVGWLALAGLYAGARRSHATATDARRTLLVFVTCAVLAAVYALLQRAGLDPLPWGASPRYPSGADSVLRPFATAGNAIDLGALLAAALGIGIVIASDARESAWLVWSLALIAAAIAATLSRSALLGAAASVVVAAAAVFRVRGRDVERARALAIAGALALAVAWTAIALHGPLAARIAEGADPRAESAPARVEMARGVLALLARRPWLGVGPDSFGLAFPAVQTAGYWRNSWLGDPAQAHSAALQTLATGGVLAGAIGAAWLLVLAFALRPRRAATEAGRMSETVRAAGFAALAGLIVAGLFNPVGLAGATLFVVLTALATAFDGAPSALPGRPVAALAAAMITAIVVLGAAVGEFRSEAAAHRAESALLAALDLPIDRRPVATRDAEEWAAVATQAAPAEDELWRLRCDADLAGIAATRPGPARDSLAGDALAAARRAIALEPLRASNWDRLANAEAARQDWAAADSAFAAAILRAPVDPFVLLDRHRSELARGRPDLALATARRLVALYPEESTSHALEAAAWLAMGKKSETRTALRRALAARWETDSEVRHAAARRLLAALEADSLR